MKLFISLIIAGFCFFNGIAQPSTLIATSQAAYSLSLSSFGVYDSTRIVYGEGRSGDLTSGFLPFDTLYHFQSLSGDFFLDGRKIQTFDDAGNRIRLLEEDYTGNTWGNYNHVQYVYDEMNRIVSMETRNWNDTTDAWKPLSLATFVYTGNNLSSRVGQVWSVATQDWRNDQRFLYTYAGDNLSSRLEQVWSSATQNWVDEWRYLFSYNQDDQLSSNSSEGYDSTAGTWWQNTANVFSYDAFGNMTEQIHNTSWGGEKTVCSFNSAGNCDLEVFSNLDSGGNWVDDRRNLFSYDQSHNKTEFIYQQWDEIDLVWDNLFRVRYSWNSNGQMTQEQHQMWGSPMAGWLDDIESYRNRYYYELTNGENELNANQEIQLFPVPSNDLLNIKFENPLKLPATFTVYDALGRIDKNCNLQKTLNNMIVLSVSDLPAGVYFLQIKTSESTICKPFQVLH